jgi:bacterioferritin (cytochrome b1)
LKGNEKIIEHLNARLADELTAINQYIVHAEMCENWNYEAAGRNDPEASHRRDEARREADRPHPFPRRETYRQ